MCTSADTGENMCKVSKRPVQNCMKSSITRYPRSIHLKSEHDKVQKVQKSDKIYGKDYMKSTCTSSDNGVNRCKVAKRLVENCMRSCAHEVATLYILRVKND